jgi:NADH:ubiquinone oxidoreductase subunit F (NADH-binding)
MCVVKKQPCWRALKASAALCGPSRHCPAPEGLFGQPTVINNVHHLGQRSHHHGQGRILLQRLRHGSLVQAPCPSKSPATSMQGGLVERAFGLTLREIAV